MIQQPGQQIGRMNLGMDWHAYFQAFCQAHGGEPLVMDGRLWFRDGWSHALNDHRGPEFPPPEDQHERLGMILRWWRRRFSIVDKEKRDFENWMARVKEDQRCRSAPLTLKACFWVKATNEAGKEVLRQIERKGWDEVMSSVELRYKWLKIQWDECVAMMKELEASRERLPLAVDQRPDPASALSS